MRYQVEFRRYQRQFRQPLVTAHGVWRDRHGIILRLTEAAGRVGYGEIAPLEWFGTETLAQAWEFCQGLSGALHPSDLWTIPASLPACQFGFETAALECSQLEESGDRLSLPLPCTHKSSDLASTGFDPPQPPLRKGEPDSKSPFFKGDLGGSRSTLIPCPRCVYTVALPTLTYSALLPTGAAALQAWQPLWQQGTRTFKWKIGVAPLQAELSGLTQLLQTLPQSAKLRLDANGGLSWNTACQWLDICADHAQIEFLEQPLPVDQLDAMLKLGDRYPTSIALDESVATLPQLEWCYQQGWRGIFVVKPAIAGSPTRLRQFCQQPHIDVVWSSVFETAIARHYIEHRLIPALIPGTAQLRPLGFGTRHWFTDATLDQPEPEQLWQTL